jgi:hypothetical protein
MTAIVHDGRGGVKLARVRECVFGGRIHEHSFSSPSRFALFVFFDVFVVFLLFLRSAICRLFSLPTPHPISSSPRKWVKCQVHFSGVDVVDIPPLSPAVLPPALTSPFSFLSLSLYHFYYAERIVGVQFSVVVVEGPADCGFRRGDHVFGTVPPSIAYETHD